MRILFVAIPDSIHTARWINQISDQGWDIHLVPSTLAMLHPYHKGKITYHGATHPAVITAMRFMAKLLEQWSNRHRSSYASRHSGHFTAALSARKLATIIRRTRPDIVHSLEMQHAGYLTLEARKLIGEKFPAWILSNWGNDIYLFGRLEEHKERIRQVLAFSDHYICECERDTKLAQQFDFKGRILTVLPGGGGYDLESVHRYRQPGPTSKRRTILVKGYQSWTGRALFGLRAIALCADVLQGYEVIIHLASPDVFLAAELVMRATGIPIICFAPGDYIEGIKRFGAARIHIGLSISDGTSQSFLESMVMGAFPIQSCTACANEWIEDGRSGFIVPPEDPHIIAEALRRAVTDDALVDQAVAINDETVRQRLNYADIQKTTIDIYRSVYAESSRMTAM
jgi:glycosyltransferase involved in cell wall biosynthesis